MPVDENLNNAKRKYYKDWQDRNRERRNAYRKALRKEHSALDRAQKIDFYLRKASERRKEGGEISVFKNRSGGIKKN